MIDSDPGLGIGSVAAAENSGTRPTVSLLTEALRKLFSWSSYTVASLVVFVSQPKNVCCAVSVAPVLNARPERYSWNSEPAPAWPCDDRNPTGTKLLKFADDWS